MQIRLKFLSSKHFEENFDPFKKTNNLKYNAWFSTKNSKVKIVKFHPSTEYVEHIYNIKNKKFKHKFWKFFVAILKIFVWKYINHEKLRLISLCGMELYRISIGILNYIIIRKHYKIFIGWNECVQ